MAGEVFCVDGPLMPPKPGSHSNSRSFRKIIKSTAWSSRDFFTGAERPGSLTAGEVGRMPRPMQKELRSRQVHAQTLTTAELRLRTLIHPIKINQHSFHQEWWKAVPSCAVSGEVTGCFSKKASMRL